MAEQQFPGVHTTTHSQTRVQPQIRYDPTYIKTVPGILKVICIVLNFVGFICIQVSKYSYSSEGEYFSTIAMIAFMFSFFMLIFYLFHVLEKFYRIPWLQVEFGFYIVWTFLYLIAASLAASVPNSGAYAAAAFFGFCAMVVYGYDAFLKFRAFRSGEIAQGSRSITTQQVTSVVVK